MRTILAFVTRHWATPAGEDLPFGFEHALDALSILAETDHEEMLGEPARTSSPPPSPSIRRSAFIEHHLDPVGSFTSYDTSQVVMPPRPDLDAIDRLAREDPAVSAAIVEAVEIAFVCQGLWSALCDGVRG